MTSDYVPDELARSRQVPNELVGATSHIGIGVLMMSRVPQNGSMIDKSPMLKVGPSMIMREQGLDKQD